VTYKIAYGLDTDTIEDPDQLILITMPDAWAGHDVDELLNNIRNTWNVHPEVTYQPLVPLEDTLDSVVLALIGEGVSEEIAERVRLTVRDATDNNA
jgi:hypothetical protein